MKNIIYLFIIIFVLSCQQNTDIDLASNEYNVIPLPAKITLQEGVFTIYENTEVTGVTGLESIVELFKLEILNSYEKGSATNKVHFKLSDTFQNEEEYSISVKSSEIIVESKNASGAFYALQTLRQLKNENNIPAVEIQDKPRFSYRGMHLDVSRHFFSVDVIKKYIDNLAYHKLNRFHWHLTDDQGWRIEIKGYPKLQEISAFRKGTLLGHYNDTPHKFDGKRYGGFYTQEEVKEIVKYAEDRFITILPEIEMPGHSVAVLAAYPELGCTTGPFEVGTKWGVFDDVFCPREETFKFLEDVLLEVMALFPSKLIHIGGDECPKTKWDESPFCQKKIKKEGLKDSHELQSYFIQRIETFVNTHGRSIIGWDEILEGGLAKNASVMSWRGEDGGIEAAIQKHDVIMTPTTYCYFDYYQSQDKSEPLAIGGFLPLKKVYNYNPIPEVLTEEEAKYIKGVQGNVWTEYIKTAEELDYMLFPRAAALAEVAWSELADKDYSNFTKRLVPHIIRLKKMGVKSANHLYDLVLKVNPGEGKNISCTLANDANAGEIRYTLDGSSPTMESLLYSQAINIEKKLTLTAQTFLEGKATGNLITQEFKTHKASGKKISFSEIPHKKYGGDDLGSVVNGVLGNPDRYGGSEWLGFEGNDAECIIDFGEKQDLSSVNMRFFKGEGQWIYLPKSIEIWASDDNENYKKITKKEGIAGETKLVEATLEFEKINTQYLKIKAVNYGLIPAGAQGAGHKAWLFLDEITVD